RDSGGFSDKDRAAATTAMRALHGTGVTAAAANFSAEVGAPAICRIHIEKRTPLTFRLFVSWTPKKGSIYGYSWLAAVARQDGITPSSSLEAATVGTMKELRSHYGDALEKPSEPCRIELDGAITPLAAR